LPRPWETDHQVTRELARHLIAGQFPSLVPGNLELLGKGWDNTAFLVDGRIVFRFPRKQSAAALLETEARVLPGLAAHLPVPVPLPEWHGQPTEAFPWPFLGHRLIPGETACSRHLSPVERGELAPAIATFLARLHAVPVASCALPRDQLDRANFMLRMPLIVERLDLLHARGVIQEVKPWLDLFAGTRATEEPAARAVVHGDLYACHLLVDTDHRLCGVIDWGDVHAGDPAIDLMIVYAFLPASARAPFFEIYGHVAERTRAIARLRAAFHSISVTWYGSELSDGSLLREGRTGMQLVLEA
jgi:aminoglycoside phosphotransferase (APT) family kinase protein